MATFAVPDFIHILYVMVKKIKGHFAIYKSISLMGDPSMNFRYSRVSLGKGKDNGVMPKILDLKLDERTGVHTLRLKDGIISGMCIFLSGFQFLGFMASCSPVAHHRTSITLLLFCQPCKPIAFLQPPCICNSLSLAPLLGSHCLFLIFHPFSATHFGLDFFLQEEQRMCGKGCCPN